jgi:periplasmic divalent cation tolerance protein
MTNLILVLTTMPDDERADGVARALVDERLAACVNVLPIRSTYRWKGALEVDAERQLVIKTTRARLPDVQARLQTLHPYELPECIIIDGEGSAAYTDWVRNEVSAG